MGERSPWTCGWPGCARPVSENRAFCQAHYLLIPKADRGLAVKAVFAARERAGAGVESEGRTVSATGEAGETAGDDEGVG